MTQDTERLTNDEETDAQAVASRGIKTSEGIEDARNVLSRNSNARVVYIDPDFRTGMPATKKDTTSWLGVLDCIADQIAQDSAEQQAIAHDHGPTGNDVDAYALAQRILLTLSASLPQNLMDAHGLELETLRTFSDA